MKFSRIGRLGDMETLLFYLSFLWLLGSFRVDSKYMEGFLNTHKDWEFLARFCWLSQRGKLEFEFEYPQKDYEPQNLLLYYDDPDQWPAVYNSDKNCWQREAVLRPENNQVIYLTLAHYWSGCKVNYSDPDNPVYQCKGSRSFRSSRERWWYVAASHCGSTKTCLQKEAVLKPQNNQVINLTTAYHWSGCTLITNTSYPEPTYFCNSSRTFRSSRERWWFLVIDHCNNPKTCKQKASPPHIKPENNQMISLSTHPNHYWSGCKSVEHNITKLALVRCEASRSFRSSRERWWFLAISRCVNDTKGLNLKYKVRMTNGDSFWTKHFSADEFYILEVDIAFLLATTLLLVLSVAVAFQLKKRQLFHTTYKMYMVALSCEVGHLFIMCINYGKYAENGIENYSLKTFGRVLESANVMVFLLMLILMAKGYTITRGRLSTSGSIKIAVFMTLYVIVYAVLFIYEANFFDPGEVLYIYESPPGYGLIAMRLLGWIWFCYAIFFTLKHYPEKSKFYYPFFIFYTIWFWAFFDVVMIASCAIPLWQREKVINGLLRGLTFLGSLYFMILTRPNAANKNFPYHVRTSQIGVMSATPHQGAPSTAGKETDSFSSHPYAVSDPPPEYSTVGGPNFSELFTVSNTRSSSVAQGANFNDHKDHTKNDEAQNGAPRTEQSMPKENGHANGSIDRYPHHNPDSNPFITQR